MSNSNLGLWKIAVDTANLADGASIAAYLTDAAGNLLESTAIGGNQSLYVKSASEHAEDSAHTSGDYGSLSLVVRNDAGGSLADADGDYAPLQVDASGRLRVLADLTASFDFTYAEDSAHADGDVGAFVLAVRQDTLASSTSATGDYGAFKQTALGELYVHDVNANASLDAIESSTASIDTKLTTTNSTLSSIDTSLNNIETDVAAIETELLDQGTTLDSILTELQGLSHAEDSVHTSGDAGIMSLAVRNDAGTALAADGDYIPLSTDSSGNLRVAGTFSIPGSFAEDSAHTNADQGLHTLAVRKDALSSNVGADGDYASFLVWSEGSLKTVDQPNISILGTAVTVTNSATALPASALANRRTVIIQNRGNNSIFIGPSGVTTANGVEVPKYSSMELSAGPSIALYGITAAGTADVRVTELS
jgi:hypothetical protein